MSDKDNFLYLLGPDNESIQVHAGAVIMKKGERGTDVYVIKAGQMEIFDGPTVYETIGPGDMVGEMAMIDQEPRSASVRAVTECEVIVVDARRFITLIERTPTFAIRVMRVLVRRMRDLGWHHTTDAYW